MPRTISFHSHARGQRGPGCAQARRKRRGGVFEIKFSSRVQAGESQDKLDGGFCFRVASRP
eukprot:6880342-Pyramimonas_sp.AAC.1